MAERAAGGTAHPAEQRLSKCVMALRRCSRAEAERLIEAGWVCVGGAVVDDPAHRALPEQVTVAEGAESGLLRPVTVLWHQPPGPAMQDPHATTGRTEAAGLESLVTTGALTRWHLRQLKCMTPLPARASGLVVWVQDVRLQRAWQEQAAVMEEEWRVEWRPVSSPATPFGWPTAEQLQLRQAQVQGQGKEWLATPKPLRGTLAAQRHFKAGVSSQNAERVLLRVVMKGYDALSLPEWLNVLSPNGWQPSGLHRQRLGRLALGQLQPGSGRILDPLERF